MTFSRVPGDEFFLANDSNATVPTNAITKTAHSTKNAADVDNRVSGESSRYEFVVDTTPDYSALDQIGARIEIANAARLSGGGGELVSMSVLNHANIVLDVAFFFFKADPTSAADNNAALAITNADMENFMFAVTLSKGRFYNIGSSCATLQTSLRYECDATSLWVVAQALSTTNFAATDDLQIILGLRKD